jgi:methylmalonyl-CoA/ethylmalonyl-CoA epimerase
MILDFGNIEPTGWFVMLEIEHICIVVKDLESAIERFQSLFGIGPFRVFDSHHPDGVVHGQKMHYSGRVGFAQAGPAEIELIEPGQGESIWREFLEEKGEGVHHVGVFVPDIDKELARYEEKGIGILQTGENDRIKLAYVDTEPVVGLMVELLQRK